MEIHLTDFEILMSSSDPQLQNTIFMRYTAEKILSVAYYFLVIFSNITHKWNIWGTCWFLGTTMLFFEKFMKNRNFFI